MWRGIMEQVIIDDYASLELLQSVCEAGDIVAECERRVAEEGVTSATNTGLLREHPAVKTAIQYKAFISRSLARLGLLTEALKAVGRPAGMLC
jgi:hypothetical protein